MLVAAVQSPVSGNIQHQRSSRKPLQPTNKNNQTPNSTSKINPSTPQNKPKPKPIQPSIEIVPDTDNNKENIPPFSFSSPLANNCNYSTPVKNNEEPFSFPIESLDASLAEELSAIREKLDRLRIDREKTEKMLGERGLMLDLRMKELINRGDTQKQLEIEVDRLFRLKEIKLACCLRRSPVRTLRDKEQEKKIKQDQLKANIRTEDDEGVKDHEDDEHREESTQSDAESHNMKTETSTSSSTRDQGCSSSSVPQRG